MAVFMDCFGLTDVGKVRGMANIKYVATLRALGLNIRRVAAYRSAAG